MEAGGRLIDAGGCPAVRLAGRRAQAIVYLPDPVHGYYRGPRFDWSGLMPSLRLDGHEFFGEWKAGRHDPLGNDFVVGPAGEFGMGPDTGNPPPIGWEEAAPGGAFLKIGAGVRRKTDDGPYRFGGAYPLVTPPRWRVRWGSTWMACSEAASLDAGWGYAFTKRIEVDPDLPRLTIAYRLANTGRRAFRQTWYCHNFIRIDERPIGVGYRLEVPFAVRFARTAGEAFVARGAGTAARGGVIELARDLEPAEGAFAAVEGFGTDASHNAVVVRGPLAAQGPPLAAQGPPPAALRIDGSVPVHAFSVFATGRCLCPELFVDIELAPGAELAWTDRYALAT